MSIAVLHSSCCFTLILFILSVFCTGLSNIKMARQEDKICSLDHEIREITDQRLQSVSSHLEQVATLCSAHEIYLVLCSLASGVVRLYQFSHHMTLKLSKTQTVFR